MTNTYLPHVGGVARSVSSFTREYLRLGHDVLVVAPDFKQSAAPFEESHVERVPAITNFNDSEFAVRLPLTDLSDRIRSFDADIVHTHHPFLFGETALREGAIRNVPVVFTYHTNYEDYVYTLPFVGKKVGARTMAMAYAAIFANRCDGVIAPSESVRKILLARGVHVPIRVIPTGIDVDGIAGADRTAFRRRIGIPSDRFVVGHVGRLAPEKNLAYLAKSVALFMMDEPESVFLVVGSGPEEETIRKAFEKEGIADQLLFAGKRTGIELYEAYKAMDVFAFASKSETQGLVIAEAMAAGLPIVALRATGSTDALAGEGRRPCSLTLIDGNAQPGYFALALSHLHGSPRLREQMGADSAQRAREAFHWDVCAGSAIEFYETVRGNTRRLRLLIGRSKRRKALRWLRAHLQFAWHVWRVLRIVWTDHRRRKRSEREQG